MKNKKKPEAKPKEGESEVKKPKIKGQLDDLTFQMSDAVRYGHNKAS